MQQTLRARFVSARFCLNSAIRSVALFLTLSAHADRTPHRGQRRSRPRARPPFFPHCESFFLCLRIVALAPLLPMHPKRIPSPGSRMIPAIALGSRVIDLPHFFWRLRNSSFWTPGLWVLGNPSGVRHDEGIYAQAVGQARARTEFHQRLKDFGIDFFPGIVRVHVLRT
jgi:hypothetical protein